VENIAQVLQLGLSGVLAAGIVALWQEFKQQRKEQREDQQRFQQILLQLLEAGIEDRQELARAVGADIPSRTDLKVATRRAVNGKP
jgi:type II secretory pathway pseudopilin PulG